ncbi:hypothetical protein [Sphingorhabdus sp. Alg231-15]|uniref:hypothetical protein n=1 Tax=Sphingorhabdus sp. Alg231-15 TaxID=1922222 RepID=UPI000D54DED0
MGHKTQIMYVELKSGHGGDGPAWITETRFTKSGRGVYFQDKLLLRGNGVRGNFFDEETGEEYWVSGVKKNRQDRHVHGGGPVQIDEKIRAQYEAMVG